ncbi:MAG: hypothetical protein AN488_08485 [Anabaena sp. WA113]|nr:MAG: hypothetical protein AN488_08485 [Anabaena sp. WA113]
MKYHHLRFYSQLVWLLTLITSTIATSALAQPANFAELKLSPGFKASQGTIIGNTGGTDLLSRISNRDQNQNVCTGFATTNPDHILILEQDFDKLKILVDSGGQDTTLLIKGPEGADNETVRCGDDTGKNKDASIDSKQWRKGTYKIWVGTFDLGLRQSYTLTVQQ